MATSMAGESATTKAELVEMSTLFGWQVDGIVLPAHVGVMTMIVMMMTKKMRTTTTTTTMTTVTVTMIRMMRKKEGERE